MNIEIAMRLVELRKKHGYSQEELADKLGVSRQAVSKWERVEASPDTDNLIAIAKLYNVSLDELLALNAANAANDSTNADEAKFEDAAYDDAKRFEDEANGFEKNEESTPHREGLNFVDDDGSTVHIGKNGIHVTDAKKGDEVHVGWSGIHIIEGGQTKYDSNKDGMPHEFKHVEPKPSAYEITVDCVATVLVVAGYLLLGFLGGWWHPGWLIFFAQPLLASLLIPKRWEGSFPIAVVAAFLLLGFLGGWWHPGWVVFFAIPVFYSIWNLIKTAVNKHKKDKIEKDTPSND